jgi:hypothetical protein
MRDWQPPPEDLAQGFGVRSGVPYWVRRSASPIVFPVQGEGILQPIDERYG